jgi:hypothetical protein
MAWIAAMKSGTLLEWRQIVFRRPSADDDPMKANGTATPRRPIEPEYLATLNAAVPLDTWQAICERAADDALAGNAKARDWLAKWLLDMGARIRTRLVAKRPGRRSKP